MKKKNDAFTIPFAGLKLGKHNFDFELKDAFFEHTENALIQGGNVNFQIELEKKETMLIVYFDFEGSVCVPCDRCNDPMNEEIDGRFRIVYKFGFDVSEDENLIVLHPEAFELDVKEQLLEFLIISLPLRVIHDEGECNPEVMKSYQKYIVNSNEPDDDDWEDFDDDDIDEDDNTQDDPEIDKTNSENIDPRWSALKNLN